MIAWVRGKLLQNNPPRVLVELAGGVGYELLVPETTCQGFPAVGQEVCLHTHVVIRPDAQLMYGFPQEVDRDLFRRLIALRGMGPQNALRLLSAMSGAEIVACVRGNNSAALERVPRVGRKLAQMLVMQLQDELGHWEDRYGEAASGAADVAASRPVQDTISALEGLGFSQAQSLAAVREILRETSGKEEPEELLRQALRKLGTK